MLLPIVAGGPGDQFNESTVQAGHILGGRMIFPDGRAFRYAENAAVLLVSGDVIQSSAPVANHVLQTPTAGVVDDRTLVVALGATAVAVNAYKDGYLHIPIGTAKGQTYTIQEHPAVASSGSFTVPLFEPLQTAVPATANSVSLIANQYKGVIQSPVTTLTGPAVGVSVSALTASVFGWLQVVGPASVTTKGTLIIGHNAAMLVTQAASVGPAAADTSVILGRVLNVGSDGNKSLIDLNIC
jgi:hypothetical protein